MTACDTMLRLKEVERTQRQLELTEARALCAASERRLAVAQRASEQAQASLLLAVTADTLCVQRLLLARANADSTKVLLEQAQLAHARHETEALQLERAVMRIEKEMEKLRDRVALEHRALEQESEKSAMRELDDWVLAVQGGVR